MEIGTWNDATLILICIA